MRINRRESSGRVTYVRIPSSVPGWKGRRRVFSVCLRLTRLAHGLRERTGEDCRPLRLPALPVEFFRETGFENTRRKASSVRACEHVWAPRRACWRASQKQRYDRRASSGAVSRIGDSRIGPALKFFSDFGPAAPDNCQSNLASIHFEAPWLRLYDGIIIFLLFLLS